MVYGFCREDHIHFIDDEHQSLVFDPPLDAAPRILWNFLSQTFSPSGEEHLFPG
jgi:hypothetical protein